MKLCMTLYETMTVYKTMYEPMTMYETRYEIMCETMYDYDYI